MTQGTSEVLSVIDDTYFIVKNLVPNQIYTFQVVAVN